VVTALDAAKNKLRVLGTLPLALALALLVLAGGSRAQAATYGELTRFGVAGHNGVSGALNEEGRTLLLGVDSHDDSVYVLDEPELEHEGTLEKGHLEVNITRHLRLQKFTSTGGSYSFNASRAFEETTGRPPHRIPFEVEDTENDSLAVEGIAVDPGLQRVYVLAVDWRSYERKVDKLSHAGSSSKFALPVASTLYAFSTVPSGGKLVPAPGTKTVSGKGEGVLAGPEDLKAQSDEVGAALLEPAGMTVDPVSHDVIILAHVDEAGGEIDDITKASDHYVLQRVNSKGEIVPGSRYTDGKSFGGPDFFAKESSPDSRPHSPVIAGPSEGEQHVVVAHNGDLVEFPAAFGSKEAPREFFAPPPEERILESGIRGARAQWAPDQSPSPENEGETVGGVLSAAPDGTIYGASAALNEAVEHEQGPYGAVLSLSSTDGSVLGWTGAQRVGARAEKKDPEWYKCVIAPLNYEPIAPVAAGSEGKVFVLALAYLWVTQLVEEEELTEFELYPEAFGVPPAPAVIEFGPEGSGCPTAGSPGLVAKVKGAEVHTVNAGEQVTFSAPLTQANALGQVEWEFGDGSAETRPTRELASIEAPHTFTKPGTYSVRAKIHTDDLATPVVTVETAITVAEGAALAPTALASGPLTALVGEVVEFDGSASSDPGGPNRIAEYHWTFGDGHSASSTKPTITHDYTQVGAYTVSLTVTNKHGVTSAPDMLPLPVVVREPPPAPVGGGGSTTATTSTEATGSRGQSSAVPDARLASTSLSVARSGVVKLRVICPSTVTRCVGNVTLRAKLPAGGKHSRLVTLGLGTFAMPGGAAQIVAVHLTSTRAFIARHSLVHAIATIQTHDPAGVGYLRQTAVTVRFAGSSRAHKHH
jgi:PKD repeat protein